MVINKSLDGPTRISLALSNFKGLNAAQVWQLAGAGTIAHLPAAALSANHLAATLPAQSITLFVLPAVKTANH